MIEYCVGDTDLCPWGGCTSCQGQQYFRPDPHDHLRPCYQKNTNVCVAEGCYNSACIKLALDKQ